MKKIIYTISSLFLFSFLISCNNKKLVEVVEVPLPTAEEKVALGSPDDVKAEPGSFLIEKLPYSYDALAPAISALNLEAHYSKHYLTYTNNLNAAIAGTEYENMSIENILAKLDINDTELRNNAGAYYNHSLYWKSMGPNAGGNPKDSIAAVIDRDFGSYSEFKNAFKEEASKQFGSAWVWLIVDKSGKLKITSSINQDNPLMRNATVQGTPILALDLWEHAYYLGHQYRRASYIDSFFNIIDWDKIQENYQNTFIKKY
jgi:Fe-Mn family superoxide dismutase